ncbi:MAG: (deoxy)nucleoside triphosphate pyrophosphohydrolase [Corynebacterium sp.]|nr:(deoxy)nucleoside triphosphate pyrophosphohydrolase [Corynebacterium sp.]
MEQRAVVGAVIVQAGAIFAAQRADSGLWEFPGGKIEPGETPQQAVVRELQEELACTVAVGEHLITTPQGRISLATYRCTLVEGIPQLREHLAARWLTREQLWSVPWAPADIPTVELFAEGVHPIDLQK